MTLATAVAVATAATSGPARPATPRSVPLVSGPRRTKLDLYFVFTNYNKDDVYVMAYKSEITDGEKPDITPTSNQRLVKIVSFSERLLRLMSLADLLPKNETIEALLAQQQSARILSNVAFTYAIEDLDKNGKQMNGDDGKLKTEFVEALFKRDQARLDEIIKSQDIEI